jgi:hypothetical protein
MASCRLLLPSYAPLAAPLFTSQSTDGVARPEIRSIRIKVQREVLPLIAGKNEGLDEGAA